MASRTGIGVAERVGIAGHGAYLPYWRLQRASATEALGRTPGRGTRTVASFDEDTTTMAVAACARVLKGAHIVPDTPCDILFASASPAYAEKTNAAAIHAALGLAPNAHAGDICGGIRSGVTALLAGMYRPRPTLVAMSEVRSGPVGSAEEISSGDAAASLLVGRGSGPLLAELVAAASISEEFLDRWRLPDAPFASRWEERFGEEVYFDLGVRSVEAALDEAGLLAGQVDHYAVTGCSPRAGRRLTRAVGVRDGVVLEDVTQAMGDAGTAQFGLALCGMLEKAQPGETMAITVLADGADTLVFRTTQALADYRVQLTVADQLRRGSDSLLYADFLTWRGQLARETPRRPLPDRASAPPSRRQNAWKFAFVGSRCNSCGTRHLPPQRVCLRCGSTDDMTPEKLSDSLGTVATYTVDRLAYSPAPPVVAAVIDFDGGGRFSCELTDVLADSVFVGQRVEMTFRRLSTVDGIHNYFWKARPLG
jgi:hydroxymethylglutaryl-CoA synthase